MNLYLENKKFNETKFKEKKLALHSRPLTLRLILTNQCNIKRFSAFDVHPDECGYSVIAESIFEMIKNR